MIRALRELLGGFASLLTGMGITLHQFFQKPVTVHYPHQTLPIPKRFRGHVVLMRDPESGQALCIACKACQKACPSECIAVEGIKREGEKKKSVTDFKLDFTKCSLCGSCVEVCPVDALEFSRAYNLAGTRKEAFHQIDLVRRNEPAQEQAGTRSGAPVMPESGRAELPRVPDSAAAPASSLNPEASRK